MAVQNMILAAVAEGLGTCPMGAPLEIKDEVNKFLEIEKYPLKEKEEIELLCALVLGYPDHEPPKAPRKIEGRIVYLE